VPSPAGRLRGVSGRLLCKGPHAWLVISIENDRDEPAHGNLHYLTFPTGDRGPVIVVPFLRRIGPHLFSGDHWPVPWGSTSTTTTPSLEIVDRHDRLRAWPVPCVIARREAFQSPPSARRHYHGFRDELSNSAESTNRPLR